ncbi:response regulator [Cypionkella aquatica]|uniref:Response regulator n=1 Tax=Cypionkella aquatica TaxID=1756042 RepID=A0AA37TRM0_9RHOB|nr:response regulator [Cypionkella aquatica]GLS86474.1 response regulator [Cypionkella aquatica]
MPSPLPSDTALPPGFMLPSPANSADLPLHGVTILAVEDSRYACEALRLMCQRAGARLRRAETLASARAHLRVYRPDVVIVDLGLPDGRGESLIAELALGPQRPLAVLGTSGNADGRNVALQSGAEGFLDKPFESFADFCATIRRHLPGLGPTAVADAKIQPDPLALRDDLSRAASALAAAPDAIARRYLTGFLLGLAHHAHDASLARAARAASLPASGDLDGLRSLLDSRLSRAQQSAAFSPKPETA